MALIFRQLFEHESSTYTYILIDSHTKKAVIIDPVKETVDRDLEIVEQMGVELTYVLETHVHADHVTGAGLIRERTHAKLAVSRSAQIDCADEQLKEGDMVSFGQLSLRVLETPGHTDTCLSFYLNDRVFTGDALLIRGCGRTDFQSGDSKTLFKSVREKLFRLPETTLVYPAHDYLGRTCSSIGEEMHHNPRLALRVGLDEFIQIMENLGLDRPKKIDVAIPANLQCGLDA